MPQKQPQIGIKPIKQIRLRTFTQIYKKQSSKVQFQNMIKQNEPRKSFLNVTRRYSTVGSTNYNSIEPSSLTKNIFRKKKLNSQQTKTSTCGSPSKIRKQKQNVVVNRIPIKIRSKRVRSKQELNQRKQNEPYFNEVKSQRCFKKLLQSPFNDEFICLERQYVIEEVQQYLVEQDF